MADKKKITTQQAPAAIGPYSQAININNTIYLSGQIPFDPASMTLVNQDFASEVKQVFQNIRTVAQAAGGDLQHIAKLTIYLTDLADFAELNEIMQQTFVEPYPARTTIQVSALPKGARVEIDAIMVI